MATPLMLFALAGFAVMGALPLTFFRRGRLSAGWLVTAAPFLVDATWLIGALGGVVPLSEAAFPVRATLAAGTIAASIGLIVWTVRTHRLRPALWHQADDEPAVLVTHGPYAHVRHPFYAAFSLLLLGTALLVAHPVTAAMLVLGTMQLYRTARREEIRLTASALGAEYRRYMERTGRLIPRL